jgi:hypothetical protein
MRRIALLAVLVLFSTQAAEAEYLYKMTMVRAAPGKLLDLIDLFEKRMSVYETSGDEAPLRMRHAQGDQWDLLIMYPIDSFSKYYAPERVEQRKKAADDSGLSEEEFSRLYYDYTSFHEDMIVKGPPLPDLRKAFAEAGYFHTEMFVALAGKRAELHKEREMENDYLENLGQRRRFTLVQIEGAPWDIISLAFYRDEQEFTGRGDATPEQVDAAAKAAGFKGSKYIGPTMRSFVLYHRDTHGGTIK